MAPAIIKSHSLHIKKKEKASSRTRCPIGMVSPSLAILAELGVSTTPRSAFFVSSFFLLAFFCFFLRFFVFFVPCWLFFPDVSDVSLLFHILFFVGFCFSWCCFFSGYLDHFEGTPPKDNQKLALVWPYLIFIYVPYRPYLSILLLYAICLMIFGCFHFSPCHMSVCLWALPDPSVPRLLEATLLLFLGEFHCRRMLFCVLHPGGDIICRNSQTIGVPSRKTGELMGFLMRNCLSYDI